MNTIFYVMDYDYGTELDEETCGCVNQFNTYKQAIKVCKKVSRHNKGRFTVSVAVPSTCFENGIEIEDL